MADDTANHDYRRPSKGTENWHRPLNRNFARIDTGVEIRDKKGNRQEYEPKENAKFLATDSGEIYLGDGDQWQKIGQLVTGATESNVDGTIVAPPGDLQSAIDRASTGSDWAQSPMQTVKLVSGQNYKIDSTIKIRPNVRVECNGARIVPTKNVNIFEVYRGTQLIEPFCDTRGTDWNATQVVIGPEDASSLGVLNRTWVKDAFLVGTPGKGIGLQFRGDDGPCSLQYASGTISGFNRAIDIYAAGSEARYNFSNGNQFEGRIRNFRIGLSMRSEGAPVSGNFLRLQAQPSEKVSEWLWKMDRDPRNERKNNKYLMKGNTVIARAWDVQNYESNNPYYGDDDRKSPVWFIGRGNRYGNSLWDIGGVLSNEYIVNNSDTPSRNGIFTAHGGFVTGTSQYQSQPVYEPNAGVSWHKESDNG